MEEIKPRASPHLRKRLKSDNLKVMKKANVLLWGDLCIDRNNLHGRETFGPGGAAYFCANVFKKFGYRPLIISPRGRDYNDKWLGSIPVFPKEPLTKSTLLYQNRYGAKGQRTLFAGNQNSAFFINPLSVPKALLSGTRAVIVCPIDNNISPGQLKKLRTRISPKTLLACLPQGFFRRYKKSGRVYQAGWQNAKNTIPYFDMIFLSEEDGKNLDVKCKKWSKRGPVVVLTRAERGCSIFENGKQTDFPAFPVKKVSNPVGAGDVFAAAFIHASLSGKNTAKAAIFANAIASRHIQSAIDKS